MPTTSRASRRALAGFAGLAVAVSGLALAVTSPANAASSGLVISEVYGGGGNAGAALTNDFIELYNPTSAAISVAGMSVQYRSSAGTAAASGVTSLAGSVPAGGHYLVQEAAGTGGTTALPTPDATGTIAMSGTAFTVWLATGTTALNPAADGSTVRTGIVDLVGVNSNTFETAKTAATANATSASRTGADTDNNASDFAVGTPSPQNAGTVTPPPDDDPTPATIAEIQGTGDTSPLAGDTVITEGVVTAAYPTGGFNGFYLQTPGNPDTPNASDGVFVYGSAATAEVAIGDSVQVTGDVSEFQGTTEISGVAADDVTVLPDSLGTVTPLSVPWSDLDTPAEKEAHEGELVAPQGDFTVTDNYNTNFYGEIELASGDRMLEQPTDVGTPGSADAQAAAAYNTAHAVFLDDGASWSYTATSHSSDPLPWLTPSTPVSDGAQVTFHQPVILEYRNSQWDLQPAQQVSGDGSDVATFSDMRTQNAQPAAVGGDVRLATFNMENFFTTTGQQFVADNAGAHCTYYNDRAGTPVGDNDCEFADGSAGPRGAATDAAYQNQLAKELVGINGLGASVVSLEEVENAVKFGEDRDATLSALVDALNAKYGAGTWAYIPSPAAADLPPTDQQDVIRSAFIYKPAAITPVGTSHVLTGDSDAGEPFSIAREPVAQGFKATGGLDTDAFMVVANHLKSKGADASGLYSDCGPGGTIGQGGTSGDAENTDPANDQGGFNCTRVHQVHDMWAWAQQQAQQLGTDRLFLVGDFNAYDHEDPIEYLYGQGLADLGDTYDHSHSSYSYGGLEGSLDHVLATPAAQAMVTGATVWQIDAQEAVAFAYSRANYNVTQLFDGTTPWATSDHDPEVVGLDLPALPVPKTTSTTSVVAVPNVAIAKLTPVGLVIQVKAAGSTPTGSVTVSWDGQSKDVKLVHGYAATAIGPFKDAGTHHITVTYAGTDTIAPSSSSVDVKVYKLF